MTGMLTVARATARAATLTEPRVWIAFSCLAALSVAQANDAGHAVPGKRAFIGASAVFRSFVTDRSSQRFQRITEIPTDGVGAAARVQPEIYPEVDVVRRRGDESPRVASRNLS